MSGNPGGVYPAPEAVSRTMAAMEQRRELLLQKKAISGLFGIPSLDKYMVPIWPGQLLYIQALPSNGKSFAMRKIIHRIVDTLNEYGDGNRVGVVVTTEESIEQITAHWLAAMSGISSTAMLSGRLEDADIQKIERVAVAEVGSWPLYIVGHAVAERDASGKRSKTHRLSRDEISAAFDYIMNDLGKEIAISGLDYLHQVRDAEGRDRESHIRETVNWTREIALWTGAPFIVAAQSKSKVSDSTIPLGGIADIEWSMAAGQSADSIISLFMPKTKYGVGGLTPEFAGFPPLIVTEGMMFVSVAKQKDGPGGKVFLLDTDPPRMQWQELVHKEYKLNPEPEQVEISPMGRRTQSNNWPTSKHQGTIDF